MKQEFFPSKPAGQFASAILDRKLTTDYAPLVRKTAWHVHNRMSQAIDIEDLMQIGFAALVEAARGFEDRGIDFKHYASTRVKGAMIDSLRKEARMSRGNMANRRKLSAVRNQLEGALGSAPSDEQMAEAMSLSLKGYHNMLSATAVERIESLDEIYSDHAIWFADKAEAADSLVEKSQLITELTENIELMTERDALILQLYFVEDMNLDEIGATLGIGAARVCQIKKAALKKLRMKMS